MNPAIIDENEAAIRLSLLNAIAVLLDTPAAEPGLDALRKDIDAELALLTAEADPFEAGAAAAYHFVLSRLSVPAPEEKK